MKTPPLLITVLLLGAFALAARAEESKLLLRQHWEPGKVYTFENRMDMHITAPGLPEGGQSVNSIHTAEVTVRQEPGTDRKLAQVKVTAIKIVADAAGEISTFDSADPGVPEGENDIRNEYANLLGKSTTLVFDKDDKYLQTLAGEESPSDASALREGSDFELPLQPVAVGEPFTTERTFALDSLGELASTSKGSVQGLLQHDGRPHARLLTSGTITLSSDPANGEVSMKLVPGAKVTTETLFDLERRMITQVTAHHEMEFSFEATLKMTLKQMTVSTLKSITVAPPKK